MSSKETLELLDERISSKCRYVSYLCFTKWMNKESIWWNLWIIFDRFQFQAHAMAAKIFNNLGALGMGIAVVGGVVKSALYNGAYFA